MTLIKIIDPKQCEALARELQDTKRKIQASNMQHRLDKIELSRDLYKVFKPVVEAQREAASQVTKKIADLPATVSVLPPPPPEFADPLLIAPPTDTVLRARAQQYLQLSMTTSADHTFGLRSENDGIFIGSSPVTFDGDNFFMDSVRYKGTIGLWELMVKKKPESFELDDLDDYADILKSSGAMYKCNSILSRTP